MKVEVCRCWADNTWDTEIIEIDMNVPDKFHSEDYENIDVLVQEYYERLAAQSWKVPAFTSVYHIFPEDE